MNIATSEYAHFANTLIPRKEKKGSVIAILGWFHDKNSSQGDYQLTIRSLDDLEKGTFGVLEPKHKKEALFSIKTSKIKYILRSGICHS